MLKLSYFPPLPRKTWITPTILILKSETRKLGNTSRSWLKWPLPER